MLGAPAPFGLLSFRGNGAHAELSLLVWLATCHHFPRCLLADSPEGRIHLTKCAVLIHTTQGVFEVSHAKFQEGGGGG